jgi:RIO-like serine/threonine protein kinase
LLKARSRSLPSPLNSAINQVLKAYQTTIYSTALLEKEVSELRAANETKKRKRTRSKKQIASKEGLTVLEASTLAAQLEQAVLAQIPRKAESAPTPLQPRKRALPKCSICRI